MKKTLIKSSIFLISIIPLINGYADSIQCPSQAQCIPYDGSNPQCNETKSLFGNPPSPNTFCCTVNNSNFSYLYSTMPPGTRAIILPFQSLKQQQVQNYINGPSCIYSVCLYSTDSNKVAFAPNGQNCQP